MTTQNYQHPASRYAYRCRDHKTSRIAFGALIIAIGTLVLLKKLGLLILPFHVWPLILIAIGIYSGVKHRFRHFGSWALITLGILFSIPRFLVFGVLSTHLVAPLMLIVLGIYLIVKPRRRYWQKFHSMSTTVDEDVLSLDVTFGERNAVVTSKNFKGGTISSTFSETKLNLMQADSKEPMVLDVSVSFGTLDILIPSHWDVEFQVSNSFASVEDKRYMRVVNTEEKRMLIIRGNCSFGSIDIKTV